LIIQFNLLQKHLWKVFFHSLPISNQEFFYLLEFKYRSMKLILIQDFIYLKPGFAIGDGINGSLGLQVLLGKNRKKR